MTGLTKERIEGGRHVDWSKFERQHDKPLITIITSTYNAAKELPWTIESIRSQTYPNIQWVVVDGASTDETVELLKKNNDLIDIWISEVDDGIYDAWNKAVELAEGDWIQFIGAGDELAAPDVLDRISSTLASAHPKYDLVYGRLQYISETTRKVLDEVGMPWEEMKGKWEFFRPKLPIHPEVFHHSSLMNGHQTFDTSYKIAGDSHFLMKCIKHTDMLYVPVLIDKMPLGGASGTIAAAYKTSIEIKRASKELGYRPPIMHVIKEETKLASKRLLVWAFPEKLVFFVADCYRLLTGKRVKWCK